MRKTIIVVVASILLPICFMLWCTPLQDESLPGVIFLWGSNSTVNEPSTGRHVSVDWNTHVFEPEIPCQGPGDTLILDSGNRLNAVSVDSSLVDCLPVLHKYVPYAAPQFLSDLCSDDFICRSLDYDSSSRKYLWCGQYDGDKGIFLLDSSLLVVSKIPFDGSPNDSTGYFPKGAFVDSATYVILCQNNLYLVSEDGGAEILAKRVFSPALSHDGSRMVYCRSYRPRERKKDTRVFLLDVDTGLESQLAFHGKQVTRLAFSPDDRCLAFVYQTYNLGNTCKLEVYDFESGESRGTGIAGWGSLLWTSGYEFPE